MLSKVNEKGRSSSTVLGAVTETESNGECMCCLFVWFVFEQAYCRNKSMMAVSVFENARREKERERKKETHLNVKHKEERSLEDRTREKV